MKKDTIYELICLTCDLEFVPFVFDEMCGQTVIRLQEIWKLKYPN